MKTCPREQLTRVVQLIKAESNSERHMVDKVAADKFQLKIDAIQKPVFDKCMMLLQPQSDFET